MSNGRIARHLGPDASDELFAKAMVSICDGYPPDCSYHQTCMHDGDCFRGPQNIQAAREIERVAALQDGGVKNLMLDAARALRLGQLGRSAQIVEIKP